MHARIALALLFVAASAGSVGSAPPEKASGAVWPEGFLESLENHADPAAVLRVMERALDGTMPPAARLSGPAPRTSTSGDARTFHGPRREYADVPIAADPGLSENRPAVATSPRHSSVVVSAYVAAPFPIPETRCLVTHSLDRGSTWSAPVFLPMLTGTSLCDSPVLAYSSNGRTLFSVYRDFKSGATSLEPPPGGGTRTRIVQKTDVLLSRSQDDGRTWSASVLAIEGDGWSFVRECVSGVCTILDSDPGETLERPTLATAPEAHASGRIYVAANGVAMLQPPDAPPTAILFARSRDGGRHWSARTALAEGVPGTPAVVVQGGRVAAGPWGEVLVAWYDSGTDGLRQGTFEIRTRRSGDHGKSWDDSVSAVVNEGELGLNLGPAPTLKTWWTGMFPDVAVDGFGRAHLAYTHDPELGNTTAEEGDIRYVTSPRCPFRAWSSPVTVNDDGSGRAQGFPSLAVRRVGPFPILEVVWEDSRLAPAGNLAYDIFHSRLLPGRWFSWSCNRRVTDVSSTQDGVSTGDRTGLAANPSGLIFAVWTDRRDKASTGDGEDDVHGSRIAPW